MEGKNEQKYYWLKLNENFFNQKIIKYLRKLSDENTLTIIYFKMLNQKGGVGIYGCRILIMR